MRNLSGVIKNILKLNRGNGCIIMLSTKNHFLAHLKQIHFIECQVYFNKDIPKWGGKVFGNHPEAILPLCLESI